MPLLFPPELQAALDALDDPTKPIDFFAVGGALATVRASFSPSDPRNSEAWLETVPFNLSTEAEQQEPFRSYFGPIGSYSRDGTTIFSPDPREAGAEGLELWRHRRDHVKHPLLIARYADLLWDLSQAIAGQRRDAADARKAIDAYLAAATADLFDHEYEKAAGVLRAVGLTCSIGDADRIASATDALFVLHDELRIKNTNRYLEVVETLLWHRHLPVTDEQKATIVNGLEESFANATADATFNPFDAKDAAHVLSKFYGRHGKRDEVRRIQAGVGRALEKLASMGNALAATSHLDTAMEAHARAGDKEEVERLRVAKVGAVERSIGEMSSHEFRHEVPKKDMDEFLAGLVSEDAGFSMARIAARFVEPVEKLKERVLPGERSTLRFRR